MSIWAGRGYWTAEGSGAYSPAIDPKAKETLDERKGRAHELLQTTDLACSTIAAMTALSLGTVLEIEKELKNG